MGMWIEYEELFTNYGGPLAENSPPNAAIGVILILLLISFILYKCRKSLRLITAELIFIYAALLVAAPLMTQGMWHRVFGLLAPLSHEQDFKSYESMPTMLWPHGKNLIVNGRFVSVQWLDGFAHTGGGTISKSKPTTWRGEDWTMPVLENTKAPDAVTLAVTIPMKDARGRVQLRPGENFLFSTLVKVDGLQATSSYFVRMRADNGQWTNVIINTANTNKNFTNPAGLERIGICPLTIPTTLQKELTLAITLNGPGTLALMDLEFFNSQAIEGVYTGRQVVQQKNWEKLGANERNFTLIKPDNMFSLAGLRYLLTGFIPWDQWLMPLFAWSVLIFALFLGFLGFNVIMRKQWADNERFTFPMNIIPRQLFGEEVNGAGDAINKVFSNRIVWLGFGVMLFLTLLKGLHFYYPGLPAPAWSDIWAIPTLATYVTDPLLKAFLGNCMVNVVFCLFTIMLLVETDMLFSIWASFLLFQFTYMFGKAFNFNRFAGYPWEWQQAAGSFTAYAVLAMVAGRRHLVQVFRHIFKGNKLFDDSQEVVSYRTALLLVIISMLLITVWGVWTKMGWQASLIFFGWMVVCGFAASKLRAECGASYGYWMPYFGMFFVAGVGGFATFGATGMLVATIASGFMLTSCFLFISPVQVEMMELGRHFRVRPRDIGWGLFIGLLGGLVIGGFVMLSWAYGFGADNLVTKWPYGQNWYFNSFREGLSAADNAISNGGSLITPATRPLDFINNINAKGMGIGFVVTCIIAGLRGMFTWFPLHPLGYVLATSFFGRTMWFTAFLAWVVRSLVFRIGGAHTIRKGLVPFVVGAFLACIVSIIIFDLVGFYLRSIGITEVYSQWP